MKRFEHTHVVDEAVWRLMSKVKRLEGEGWELVDVVQDPSKYSPDYWYAFLKREVSR